MVEGEEEVSREEVASRDVVVAAAVASEVMGTVAEAAVSGVMDTVVTVVVRVVDVVVEEAAVDGATVAHRPHRSMFQANPAGDRQHICCRNLSGETSSAFASIA